MNGRVKVLRGDRPAADGSKSALVLTQLLNSRLMRAFLGRRRLRNPRSRRPSLPTPLVSRL